MAETLRLGVGRADAVPRNVTRSNALSLPRRARRRWFLRSKCRVGHEARPRYGWLSPLATAPRAD